MYINYGRGVGLVGARSGRLRWDVTRVYYEGHLACAEPCPWVASESRGALDTLIEQFHPGGGGWYARRPVAAQSPPAHCVSAVDSHFTRTKYRFGALTTEY
ncbi:hypothetical protein EVAR_82853_1 [Eumeta japonica]|uniref:Uncharacterized protein n=1 Tax=Eumeta variegata TaxID=151549 RepID=A0A4C1V4S9_EUMVA|nr:hypothetical protein EVAR_82853_1 [Eumeta japonica]